MTYLPPMLWLADDQLKHLFKAVNLVVHAGDVGHHGGHQGSPLQDTLQLVLASLYVCQCALTTFDRAQQTFGKL
jgi:hypothetical protein